MSKSKITVGEAAATTMININVNGLIQSPYLYLQAAGSDQTDASSKGVHLRWRFQKSLGDKHLAKGNYTAAGQPYATSTGFNKPDDYVRIYRAPYTEPFQVRIQFKDNILPTTEIKSGNQRVWRYNNVPLLFGTGTVNVNIRFTDTAQYDTLRAGMPALKPETLMKQYKGVVEVEPLGKLFFRAMCRVAFNTGAQTSAYLRAEAVSYDDPSDPASVFIAFRKKFMGAVQRPDHQRRKPEIPPPGFFHRLPLGHFSGDLC